MAAAGADRDSEPHTGKKPQLVRVTPRYVRLRRASEIRYRIKLVRAPARGAAVTIQVCVITPKCGVVVQPAQLVVTASDWRTAREILVTSALDAEIRTVQIHHKIQASTSGSSDPFFTPGALLPSVFVSVLPQEAAFLFAFGCGRHGRLGTPDDEKNADVPTPFACKWLHPVQLACGAAHTAVVDVYSNLYCFGDGAQGQLGQGDAHLDPSKIPVRVPALGTTSVLQVACGRSHTLCLTVEGKVFAWGDNSFGQLGLGAPKSSRPHGVPARVDKLVNARSLFCGGHHSFVVLQDQSVLAAGSNIAGQLGLGDRIDRTVFERIVFFRTLMAAKNAHLNSEIELACGNYHSLALCGQCVYSWGNGDDGRLGHGAAMLESCLQPTVIAAFDGVPIKSIACGGSHSGAIAAQTFDVYLWGNGQYGQLGHGLQRNRRVPTKVRLLQGKHAVQLAFGEWHSLALCADSSVYAWGFGEEGQLGLPDEDTKSKTLARVVTLPTIVYSLSGTGATMVRCGSAHSFVVSALETRRSNLVRLHRKASRLEVSKELERLARQMTRAQRQETCTGAMLATVEEQHDKPSPSNTKTFRHTAVRRPQTARCCEEERDCTDPWLANRASESWKDRPMTTRMSVRTACRQQVKALAQATEDTREFLASLSPTKSPRTVISPRIMRLHKQVQRSTEAGAAAHRFESMITEPSVAQEIARAVGSATEACARGGASSMVTRDPPVRVRPEAPEQDTDKVQHLLQHLRGGFTMETASEDGDPPSRADGCEADFDSQNDDDDEVIVFSGSSGPQALERAIRSGH